MDTQHKAELASMAQQHTQKCEDLEASVQQERERCAAFKQQAFSQGFRAALAERTTAGTQLLATRQAAHMQQQQLRITTLQHQNQSLQHQNQSLQHQNQSLQLELQGAQKVIEHQKRELNKLHSSLKSLRLKRDIYRHRSSRGKTSGPRQMQARVEKARECHLKYKGVFTPRVRTLVARLRSEGVSANSMMKIILLAARLFDVKVVGKIDRRDVARFTRETGILAKLQVMYDIKNTKCEFIDVYPSQMLTLDPALTVSADGTSIRSVAHESRHMQLHSTYQSGKEPRLVTRTLGVHRATNHTAKTQLAGLQSIIREYAQIWNDSPLGVGDQVDGEAVFTRALCGYKGNGSADQDCVSRLISQWKVDVDRRVRGTEAAQLMSNHELLELFTTQLKATLETLPAFSTIPDELKDSAMQQVWSELLRSLGQQKFDVLDLDEQVQTDFFVRMGCAMHKDLNSTKGGDAAMRAAYDELEIEQRPIELPNKAAVEARKEDLSKADQKLVSAAKYGAQSGKSKKIPRGAAHTVSILAAILNHKDDGRGEHDTWRWWLESRTGKLESFLDASNSRFGCFVDGATVIIIHLENIKIYLCKMRDHKASQAFVNIQLNASNALNDVPTIVELVVLAVYGQAISRPFMA
jgi:hypothetical protein